MGLFSGIKKAFKKIKKVFKKIVKGIGKVFGKDFMKIIGVGLALFTGGASLSLAYANAGIGGLLKAGVSNLINKAVSMIKMPIDLIGKGISGVGNVTGAEALKSFGKTMVDGADALGEKLVSGANNILGGGPASENLAGGGAIEKISSDSGVGIDDIKDGAASVEDLAAAEGAASGVDTTTATASDALEKADAVGDGGILSKAKDVVDTAGEASGKDKGFFSKLSQFEKDHPTLSKFALDAGGAYFQNDNEAEDHYRERAKYESSLGLSEEDLRGLQEEGSFDMTNRNSNAQSRVGMLATAAAYGNTRTGGVAPLHPGQKYQYGAPPTRQLEQA